MTITTAQYKAAIEAKIAAATGATALKDLTLIKTNADLWLLNNDGGTITGYATLEGLIQTKQNALAVGSSNTDLSLVGVSAFPKQPEDATTGFKNRTPFTVSDTFTVPAGVYRIAAQATGGGGGGAAQSGASNTSGGGGAAASTAISYIDVTPGQVFTITVGAKGLGSVDGANATDGGASTVKIGDRIFCYSAGGIKGLISTGGIASAPYCLGFGVHGSSGGNGNITQTGAGTGSSLAMPCSNATTMPPNVGGGAAAGTAGAHGSAGGAGGCSFYGKGGNGGNGANASANVGSPGANASSTNYGAGGGGSGGNGTVSSGTATGGNGADGYVEIYY